MKDVIKDLGEKMLYLRLNVSVNWMFISYQFLLFLLFFSSSQILNVPSIMIYHLPSCTAWL